MSNVEQIIKPNQILMKTYVNGLLIEACIKTLSDTSRVLSADYPKNTLLPEQVNILFTIYNGNEKLSSYPVGLGGQVITLAELTNNCESCLKYLSTNLPQIMRKGFYITMAQTFRKTFSNIWDRRSIPKKNIQKITYGGIKAYIKELETELKKELDLIKPGRPQGGFKFKQVDDFLKKLLLATNKLKEKKKKITANSLCKSMEPTADLKTFKTACERFELDQDKLLNLLKSDPLPTVKQLLSLAKKEDRSIKSIRTN
jgi:hypothetical protein